MDDCPMQYMSGQLCNFEDDQGDCTCDICSGTIACDALWLPVGCVDTSRRLLRKVVLRLSESFEPDLYSIGDIARLVVARHAEALKTRARKRSIARAAVRAARAHWHQVASGKRTMRIEALRARMGDVAFSQMVQQQLDQRRCKGLSGHSDMQWAQTERWWHSSEGRQYRTGPPCPHAGLVADVLTPERSARCCRPRFPKAAMGDLSDSLMGSTGPSAGAVVVAVPPRSVARFAAAAIDWNLPRRSFGHRCKCSATITVQFDARAGERVPRVHIAAGSESPLALLDAASLENLHSQDIITSARSLVSVNGRVVAITGREMVGLALPRPHDQFDSILRGPNPPTSKLPVGWDITDIAVTAQLHVCWPAAPFSKLKLVIVAQEDAANISDDDVMARLQEALLTCFLTSERRYDTLRNIFLWPARASCQILDLLQQITSRCMREAGEFSQLALRPCCDMVTACADLMCKRLLSPMLSSAKRCVRSAYLGAQPAFRVIVDSCRHGATGVSQMLEPVVRMVANASHQFSSRLCSGAREAFRMMVVVGNTIVEGASQARLATNVCAQPLQKGLDCMKQRLATWIHWTIDQGSVAIDVVMPSASRVYKAAERCTQQIYKGLEGSRCRHAAPFDWAARRIVAACDSLGHACQYVSSIETSLGRAWHSFRQGFVMLASSLQRQREPVRLTRVRRHDERHTLS